MNVLGDLKSFLGNNGRTLAPAGSELPAAPTLSSPADGASVAHASFAPAWTAAARATSYDFEYADDSGFTTNAVTTSVLGLTTSPGLPAATYYWRVRARNRRGASAWTTGRSVTLT